MLQCLQKTIQELLSDLETVFPELVETVSYHRSKLETDIDHYVKWFTAFYEKYFMEITSKNDVFLEQDVEFLEGLSLKTLYDFGLTENIKKSLWKYLQLISLYIFNIQCNTDNIMDTLKQWTSMIEEGTLEEGKLKELQQQTQNLMKLIQNMSSSSPDTNHSSSSSSSAPMQDVFMDKLKDSKIAKLAEELVHDIDLPFNEASVDGSHSMDQFMKTLGKDPKKIINMMKTIGNKIQDKLGAGDLRQEELFTEAQELFSTMKESDVFQNLLKQFTGTKATKQLFTTASGGAGAGAMQTTATRNRLRKKLLDKYR
jgi:hypothetical protein